MRTNDVTGMEEYTVYLREAEYQFYSADNDAEALRLSLEAKGKGYDHCLFNYIIGFCFNNGRGGAAIDKRKAGEYFLASAEARDTRGDYYDDKHADESRAILAEDYSIRNNLFNAIDANKAIDFCNALISHNRYTEDALLYLTMIYGLPEHGCQNIEKALAYCSELLKISSDPEMRARAASIKRNLEGLLPRKKSMFGSRWGRR